VRVRGRGRGGEREKVNGDRRKRSGLFRTKGIDGSEAARRD
jgi:hypothetical protein